MKMIFLEKYFPASRAANIRKEIYAIKQITGESQHEYWERSMINAVNGGVFVDKTPQAARNLIENMTANSQQFGTNRSYSAPIRRNGQNVKKCGICAAVGHATDMCLTIQEESVEQVNATGGFPGPPQQKKREQISNTLTLRKLSAITLRSGRELKVHEKMVKETVQNEDVNESKVEESEPIQKKAPRGKCPPLSEYKPVASFSLALKESKKDEGIKGLYETFRKCELDTAMLNLGASINVMPYSVYASLKLRPLNETATVIQMTDISTIYPRGVIEDVLVQVDVNNGTLTMEFDGEIFKFNIFENLNFPSCESAVNNIDIIDYLSQKHKKVVNEGKLKEVMARPVKISLSDLHVPKAEELRIYRNSKKISKLTVKVFKWNRVPPPPQSKFQYDSSVILLDMEEDDNANT
ncbi:uncharacterized protein [Henckelia pumila]|uniref:uncharacterized protein n=1 Tax=Henckelia pumila TaxID=405737 RepID=UPI003C6E090B